MPRSSPLPKNGDRKHEQIEQRAQCSHFTHLRPKDQAASAFVAYTCEGFVLTKDNEGKDIGQTSREPSRFQHLVKICALGWCCARGFQAGTLWSGEQCEGGSYTYPVGHE